MTNMDFGNTFVNMIGLEIKLHAWEDEPYWFSRSNVNTHELKAWVRLFLFCPYYHIFMSIHLSFQYCSFNVQYLCRTWRYMYDTQIWYMETSCQCTCQVWIFGFSWIIFSVPALSCRRAIAIPPASASACKMLGQMFGKKVLNFSLSAFFLAI